MMGFVQGAVLSAVCFILGVQFVCFNIDHRLLFLNLTDEAVNDGFQFYTTFYNAPPAIKTLLHSILGIGLLSLIGKLHRWDESAMFFDGSSIVIYMFGLAVYLTVTIPSLRTIATPVEGVDTRTDQVEAMRILSAGNTIVIVLMGAILALQAGQEYARRTEARELAKVQAKEKRPADPQEPSSSSREDTETKKKQ